MEFSKSFRFVPNIKESFTFKILESLIDSLVIATLDSMVSWDSTDASSGIASGITTISFGIKSSSFCSDGSYHLGS